MKRYPHEAGEAEAFVPTALRDIESLPNPPKLFLRWGTPRDKEQMRWLLDEEGLSIYSEEVMRKELITGLRELLGTEDAALWEPEIKQWWDAVDQFQKEHNNTPAADVPEWHYDDEQRVIEILEQVGADWHPYRLLNAKNNRYRRMQAHAINAVVIEGFENIDLKLPAQRGRWMSVDTAMTIAEYLDVLARKHNPDHDLRPAQELGMKSVQYLFLDKETEGNSVSPAPSDQTPDSSETGPE